MTTAAFRADFSTFKNVPSRKCVQLVFEIPTEAFADALEKLGGAPNPGASVSVAIARLDVAKVEKPKRERLTSERAALLCNQDGFIDWFVTVKRLADLEVPRVVAQGLRDYLGVQSRAELDTNPEARARFEQLEREYRESIR